MSETATAPLTILIGDVRDKLREMSDASVHCVVTSPPYWALRDYGVAGQIGSEPTPEAFVATMVDVFREVRRVMRDDGTSWLNLGDTYNAYNGNRGRTDSISDAAADSRPKLPAGSGLTTPGLKPKDLVGIPWRVALALQADGWYLRQDIIWHKPSPMPESVTDRCTKAHEYIFLLTKCERYFYDATAIAEESDYQPGDRDDVPRGGFNGKNDQADSPRPGSFRAIRQTRNRRSVWTIASEPFSGAHFATFPTKLVEPCILAGTSAMGCCATCGAPRVRQTERTKRMRERPNELTKRTGEDGTGNHCANTVAGVSVETVGWQPSCKCDAESMPCTVLDPFFGAGTTGLVALRAGRRAIGIELNPTYAAMARQRLTDELGFLAGGLFSNPEP